MTRAAAACLAAATSGDSAGSLICLSSGSAVQPRSCRRVSSASRAASRKTAANIGSSQAAQPGFGRQEPATAFRPARAASAQGRPHAAAAISSWAGTDESVSAQMPIAAAHHHAISAAASAARRSRTDARGPADCLLPGSDSDSGTDRDYPVAHWLHPRPARWLHPRPPARAGRPSAHRGPGVLHGLCTGISPFSEKGKG